KLNNLVTPAANCLMIQLPTGIFIKNNDSTNCAATATATVFLLMAFLLSDIRYKIPNKIIIPKTVITFSIALVLHFHYLLVDELYNSAARSLVTSHFSGFTSFINNHNFSYYHIPM